MTDIDFKRISALVFAAILIGISSDPVKEGTDMAERLFDMLDNRDC